MTRFLCAGDLHLGAGGDYGAQPGARLRDQAKVWEDCLTLIAEHEVDAVLFAGDAFHRRRPTPAELLAFQRPLLDVNCDFLAINGNHDVESADLPSALELFTGWLDLHSTPGVWKTRGASVATLPWAPVSRLVAARDSGDRDALHQEAAELLLATARGLRERIDGPAVLLTHWSISGASTPTGVATDDFREVVLPASELEALGFDYVVAGHIHKPQDFANGAGFYVGSPAPVDFGEADSRHGVWLLEIPGVPTFLPIESRPFVTLDFDHEDVWAQMNLSATVGWDVADAVVRVRYTASEEQARKVDHAELRRSLLDAGAHKVYAIQADIVRPERARVAEAHEDLAPLDAVVLWAEANDLHADVPQLTTLTADYLAQVPA